MSTARLNDQFPQRAQGRLTDPWDRWGCFQLDV